MVKSATHKRAENSKITAGPAAPPQTNARSEDATFPIVGIGASAGGLEALELFFSNVPADSGLAYVVVQHLDPTHKGIMVELLQRGCAIPVSQVVDGQPVQRNHIYVIPPGSDLALLNGTLHLMEPTAQRGLRLPIDHFLRSLAADLRAKAIGVILSGMGSDGTLGLRAIKENAGAVFVQSPDTAKFDAMPRSAIDAGLADVVALAEELPARILAFLKHLPIREVAAAPQPGKEASGLSSIAKVVLVLRERTGHDFSLYRQSTLERRIERRMGLHQLPRIGDYVRLLHESQAEIDLLFQELLIGVTSFFRDPDVWERVKADVLPALLASRREATSLRAWVPGCSTGEEAFSLAMVFKEVVDTLKPTAKLTLQIFATDLDKTAIDKARNGLYPAGIAADVSEPRLQRFFVEEGHGWRVSKEIREMVVFAPQNVVMDPPFTRLDLLCCRNLMIYLEPELQRKLIALFHYSLNPGGTMLLGSAETVASAADLFTALPGKARLYRRLDGPARDEVGVFPAAFARSRPRGLTGPASQLKGAAAAPDIATLPDLKQLAEEQMLRRFTPAAVLVTDQGDILYISGKTGRYLEPAAGKANLNLMAMARESLNHALAEGFHRALREQASVTLHGVRIGAADEGGIRLDVHVQPLEGTNGPQGLTLVVFDERAPASLPPPSGSDASPDDIVSTRLASLQRELQRAHEDLQATREEMQASQEELKSTNEELQSTNEELQSTNEELTTSKEEMQSMNEELQTVNQELVSKVDELAHTADDMNNLLNSTNVATLFLDGELGVRRFTPATTRLIKLIASDMGRPITDLVSKLDYPELAEDAAEVSRTLVAIERQVPSTDGGWYAAHLMPYRTQDNRIDGLVITFSDISTAKAMEATLRDAQDALDQRAPDANTSGDISRHLDALLRNAQALLKVREAHRRTKLERTGAALRVGIESNGGTSK